MTALRKYRKKPVEIEAMQLTEATWGQVLEWAGDAVSGETLHPPELRAIHIATLEGAMRASVGDYIIRGVQVEFYPCKPDIFEQTYEEV